MSILSTRLWLIGSLALLLASSGCGSFGADEGPDPGEYKKIVEEAEASGLDVYWLGEEFAAAGTRFDQIDPSSVEADDGVTSVELHYSPSEGAGSLDVSTITMDLWRNREETNPAQFTNIERRNVLVDGRDATLTTRWLRVGQGPSNRELVIERGDSVVIIFTSSSNGVNGEEVNPLMDESVFLRIAGDVRPYPD